MIFTEKVTLTEAELTQAKELTQKVQAHDQTYSEIYLSNRYNYFPKMPTFILAYAEDYLVGMAMLYADDKPGGEVDLHVEVAPEYRRQGIANEIVQRALKILADHGYTDVDYVSEDKFLQQNPRFLTNTKLVVDDAEYNMRTKKPVAIKVTDKLNQLLKVREMEQADVEIVSAIHSMAFNESQETSQKYIEEGLRDAKTHSYLLLQQKRIVGYCAVEEGEYDYLFGLLVDTKFRGRGFATFFAKKIMELQNKHYQEQHEYVLDVELDNPAALHAYLNAGFVITAKPVYLKPKK